jgi:hypothetical protein
VWFELRPIDSTQAEACAKQDIHTPELNWLRQTDITAQAHSELVT